jgi:hypothetical protein
MWLNSIISTEVKIERKNMKETYRGKENACLLSMRP